MAGANGQRTDEGTDRMREPNTTSSYHIYLFVLAVFGQEHTTCVFALFIYLYALYLFLIVVGLFIYLGSSY